MRFWLILSILFSAHGYADALRNFFCESLPQALEEKNRVMLQCIDEYAWKSPAFDYPIYTAMYEFESQAQVTNTSSPKNKFALRCTIGAVQSALNGENHRFNIMDEVFYQNDMGQPIASAIQMSKNEIEFLGKTIYRHDAYVNLTCTLTAKDPEYHFPGKAGDKVNVSLSQISQSPKGGVSLPSCSCTQGGFLGNRRLHFCQLKDRKLFLQEYEEATVQALMNTAEITRLHQQGASMNSPQEDHAFINLEFGADLKTHRFARDEFSLFNQHMYRSIDHYVAQAWDFKTDMPIDRMDQKYWNETRFAMTKRSREPINEDAFFDFPVLVLPASAYYVFARQIISDDKMTILSTQTDKKMKEVLAVLADLDAWVADELDNPTQNENLDLFLKLRRGFYYEPKLPLPSSEVDSYKAQIEKIFPPGDYYDDNAKKLWLKNRDIYGRYLSTQEKDLGKLLNILPIISARQKNPSQQERVHFMWDNRFPNLKNEILHYCELKNGQNH